MKMKDFKKMIAEGDAREREAEIERNRPILDEVIIGENVKSLEEVPKKDYDKARKIIIADNIKEIPDNFFKNHQHMTEAELPLGLERIGTRAFFGCEGISKIKIPDTVVSVGESAFSACKKLNEVIMSDSLKEIGDYAFYWNKIKKIKLPKTVEKLGARCIATDIEKIELDKENKYFKLVEDSIISSDSKKLVLVFNNLADKLSYEIPEGIESIEGCAFEECNYKKVTVPKSIKKIGMKAFYGIVADDIILPEYLEEIGEYSFSKSRLLNLVIPDGIKEIKEGTFKQAEIRDLLLPDSIETLGFEAFSWFNSSKGIKFPKDLKRIEAFCFNRSYLGDIKIPDSVEFIGEWAFSDSIYIERINIPKSLKEVRAGAFCNKSYSRKEEIPQNLEIIGDEALEAFSFGRSVNFGKQLREIGLSVARRIKELTLYDNLEKVTGRGLWSDENRKVEIDARDYGNNILCISANWQDKHGLIINVKSSKTDELRYSIYKPFKLGKISEVWGENFEPDFDAYDKLFDEVNNVGEKFNMLLTRLECPYKLSDEARKRYEDYLNNAKAKLSDMVKLVRDEIRSKGLEISEKLYKYNIINEKVTDKLIERAEILCEREEAEYFKKFKLEKFEI